MKEKTDQYTAEQKSYMEEIIRLALKTEQLKREKKELIAKIKQQIKEIKYQNRHTVYKVRVVKRKGMCAIQLMPILPKRCLGCKNARCKNEIDLTGYTP